MVALTSGRVAYLPRLPIACGYAEWAILSWAAVSDAASLSRETARVKTRITPFARLMADAAAA
jgi:hypothetical protein